MLTSLPTSLWYLFSEKAKEIMERLFLILGRINSVLLFFVLIGAGLAVSISAWFSHSLRNPSAIEVPIGDLAAKKSMLLNIERAENITGSNTQMFKLYARQSSDGLSSDSYGGETVNALFLSGKEKAARWLFPTQSNLILKAFQLQEGLDEFNTKLPTKALYFESVAKDSNGDGKLSHQNYITIAITKPDGSALVEILPKVDKVLSHTMLDEQTLSILYVTEKVVRHAKVSTLTLAKESDQEIVKLPEML